MEEAQILQELALSNAETELSPLMSNVRTIWLEAQAMDVRITACMKADGLASMLDLSVFVKEFVETD